MQGAKYAVSLHRKTKGTPEQKSQREKAKEKETKDDLWTKQIISVKTNIFDGTKISVKNTFINRLHKVKYLTND